MKTNIDIALDIVRRAKCVGVAAVRHGATLEFPPKKLKQKRTYFSQGSADREKQLHYLHWAGIQAFADRNVPWVTSDVRRCWLEPTRRRVYAELQFEELRRVNDVLDRVRVGILEALVDEGYASQFKSVEDEQAATKLLKALALRDYPTLAGMCEDDESVRKGMRDVLGIEDDEIAAMNLLDDEQWHSLGDGIERFTTYYQKSA